MTMNDCLLKILHVVLHGLFHPSIINRLSNLVAETNLCITVASDVIVVLLQLTLSQSSLRLHACMHVDTDV